MSTDAQDPDHPVATGVVKWFDRTKGFGFVVDDCDGADILLNANVLRDFGRSSVGDGARLRVTVVTTSRGKQAQRILDLVPEETSNLQAVSADGPFLPARVKWFDKVRGFGFANVFGSPMMCSCTRRRCAGPAWRSCSPARRSPSARSTARAGGWPARSRIGTADWAMRASRRATQTARRG